MREFFLVGVSLGLYGSVEKESDEQVVHEETTI